MGGNTFPLLLASMYWGVLVHRAEPAQDAENSGGVSVSGQTQEGEREAEASQLDNVARGEISICFEEPLGANLKQ